MILPGSDSSRMCCREGGTQATCSEQNLNGHLCNHIPSDPEASYASAGFKIVRGAYDKVGCYSVTILGKAF